MIVKLCERFHCLPSEVRAEGADLIRMTRLVDLARSLGAGS